MTIFDKVKEIGRLSQEVEAEVKADPALTSDILKACSLIRSGGVNWREYLNYRIYGVRPSMNGDSIQVQIKQSVYTTRNFDIGFKWLQPGYIDKKIELIKEKERLRLEAEQQSRDERERKEFLAAKAIYESKKDKFEC